MTERREQFRRLILWALEERPGRVDLLDAMRSRMGEDLGLAELMNELSDLERDGLVILSMAPADPGGDRGLVLSWAVTRRGRRVALGDLEDPLLRYRRLQRMSRRIASLGSAFGIALGIGAGVVSGNLSVALATMGLAIPITALGILVAALLDPRDRSLLPG